KEHLIQNNINDTSNFFDLGGDSLSVVLLLIKVEKETGIKIQNEQFYAEPTINGLTEICEKENKNK
ncbi:unnamed protein product, partial [Ectocarpus fasciculatus]